MFSSFSKILGEELNSLTDGMSIESLTSFDDLQSKLDPALSGGSGAAAAAEEAEKKADDKNPDAVEPLPQAHEKKTIPTSEIEQHSIASTQSPQVRVGKTTGQAKLSYSQCFNCIVLFDIPHFSKEKARAGKRRGYSIN